MLAILDVFSKFLQIGKWQKVTVLLTSLFDFVSMLFLPKELTLEKIRPIINEAKGKEQNYQDSNLGKI